MVRLESILPPEPIIRQHKEPTNEEMKVYRRDEQDDDEELEDEEPEDEVEEDD